MNKQRRKSAAAWLLSANLIVGAAMPVLADQTTAAVTYTEQEIAAAKAAYETAKAAYDKAAAEEEAAKQVYEQAVAAKQAADSKKSAAETALIQAENAASKAFSAILPEAKSAEETAKQALSAAETVYNKAVAKREAAKQALDAAYTKAEALGGQAKKSELASAYQTASTQYATAKSAYDSASAAYDAAVANLSAAQSSTVDLSKGSYGFFETNGSTLAMQLLTSGCYAGYTKIGQAGDATSMENFQKTIEYIREGNAIRVQNGLSPLMVSDAAMAMAQSNVNATYYLYKSPGGTLNHSQQLKNSADLPGWTTIKSGCYFAENLTKNFRGAAYERGLSCLNWSPFKGWYEDEMPYYQADHDDYRAGHYRNLLDLNLDPWSGNYVHYTVTGFAFNTLADDAGQTPVAGQIFLWPAYCDVGPYYSVDEYAARIASYVAGASQTQDLSALEAAVATALATKNAAYTNYKSAEEAQIAAAQRLETDPVIAALAGLDAATVAYQSAQTEENSAKTAKTAAETAYQAAVTKREHAASISYKGVDTATVTWSEYTYLNNYITALKNAQKALEQAEKELKTANDAQTRAQQTYNTLVTKRIKAQQAVNAAYETLAAMWESTSFGETLPDPYETKISETTTVKESTTTDKETKDPDSTEDASTGDETESGEEKETEDSESTEEPEETEETETEWMLDDPEEVMITRIEIKELLDKNGTYYLLSSMDGDTFDRIVGIYGTKLIAAGNGVLALPVGEVIFGNLPDGTYTISRVREKDESSVPEQLVSFVIEDQVLISQSLEKGSWRGEVSLKILQEEQQTQPEKTEAKTEEHTTEDETETEEETDKATEKAVETEREEEREEGRESGIEKNASEQESTKKDQEESQKTSTGSFSWLWALLGAGVGFAGKLIFDLVRRKKEPVEPEEATEEPEEEQNPGN